MLTLWYLSLFVSIVSLLAGLLKKSWPILLLSTITSIPIAYYFSGANNAWKYLGGTPIILLGITIAIWFLKLREQRVSR